MTRKIAIFDTTLRDGEQSPGASMNAEDKLVIARQLMRLGVDVIEAGFPVSSPGDFDAVRLISAEVGDSATVCALSRAIEADIDVAADALRFATRPRIHTGLGVSPMHLIGKLHMTEDEVLSRTEACVAYARNLCDDVEFYAEDAGRADPVFLARVVQTAIASGATVVNVPDTTGFDLPQAFAGRISYLFEHVDGIEDVCVAVHCHNDLGMATALTLAGVASGATQVECTINGIGERAGNTAMEEVVMAIRMHGEELDAHTDIDAREFQRASRLVSHITGIMVQPNKAIVGSNAFSHSSGIHQDGILKKRDTYEIIDPADVGVGASEIMLTARSGRAALRKRLKDLGYVFDTDTFKAVYAAFLEVADKKKAVYDADLQALVDEYARTVTALYTLEQIQISCGNPLTPTATCKLLDRDGHEYISCAYGTGPVDAAYKAVSEIIGVDNELVEFSIQAVTQGIDALGEVTVRIAAKDGAIYTGRGSDGDIIVSATKAYLNALNRLLNGRDGDSPADIRPTDATRRSAIAGSGRVASSSADEASTTGAKS